MHHVALSDAITVSTFQAVFTKREEKFMTTAKKTATSAIDPNSPENWEWETKKEAAAIKIIFDTIGDTFIGQYTSKEYIQNEPAADGTDRSFWVFNFYGTNGELYAIGESYSLTEGMEDVDPGQWVRLTYVRDVPTARKLNPMKSFKVEVRK